MRIRQQGFLILTLVLFITVLSVLAATAVHLLVTQADTVGNEADTEQALYVAESGIEIAKRTLLGMRSGLSQRLACNAITGNANLTNLLLAPGRLTLTAMLYNPLPTVLTGAVTAASTTIPVVSTTGFADRGRLQLGSERIDYMEKTATSFLNAQRGMDGSVARAHAIASPITQYQCDVSAQGGVPDLTSALHGKRELLKSAIQLEQAWAVGPNNGGEVINHWNNTTWFRDGPYAAIPDITLTGISMISDADGWAVGTNTGGQAFLVRWNGSIWQRVFPAAGTPNQNLESVFCLNTNYCWAVGNAATGSPFTLFWNGTIWQRISAPAGNPQTLYDVSCANENQCLAVGGTTANPLILLWNGINWQTLTSPVNARLNGVACPALNTCWIVGNNTGGQNLFLFWNGSVAQRITAAGVPNVNLNEITCLNTQDCWAVGSPSGGNPAIAHWNGTLWQNVANTLGTTLESIACRAADACWAVGNAAGGSAVVAYWNGTTWQRATVPTLPNSNLRAVSVVGTNVQPQMARQEQYV